MNKVATRMGILTYQDNMDVIANNIANVNTQGFKPFRASLADLMYTTRDPQNEDTQYGHGVRMQKTDLMYTQESWQETGRKLDYFPPDNSFFSVEDTYGDRFYTKAGSFQITETTPAVTDEEGNITTPAVWELTDGNSSFVLDAEGNHVIVPFLTDEEGELTTSIDYDTLGTMIGMFTFANPYGIRAAGDVYYSETESSGAAVATEETEPMQGALESSGVEFARQMADVTITQRAFSANINMMKTYSEMTQLVNNLRG